MQKKQPYTNGISDLFIFILLISFLIACTSCSKSNYNGHSCRWDECPYKGVIESQFEQAVSNYTECENGSDCFVIDILHLQYPSEDYDQLEERL